MLYLIASGIYASSFKTVKPDDLSLWKPTENVSVSAESFTLMGKSAQLSSLFSCKNFELEFECKTDSGAIGGIFFHSDESMKTGYEVLLNNNEEPSEWRKSGSLSAVRNVAKRMASNDVWIPFKISAIGKQIQVFVNGVLITDYTEPEQPYRETAYASRLLSSGCLVFFNYSDAHISFRDIRLGFLPDNIQSDTEGIDETADEIIRLHQQNFPTIDYHVHLKGGWTAEQAAAQSRKYGITYGIAPNCGKNFPITDDAGIDHWLDTMKNQPFLFPMQAEGREWTEMFSPEASQKFDYRFTDAMTWTDHKGRRLRIWIPEETCIDDKQQFMDMLVDRACGIISNEPIHIYVNPTFIPDDLMPEYDLLWTEKRMQRIIDACVQNNVAIEINNRYRLPSPSFIKLAKSSGAKFTFGTNNASADDIGKLEYSIEMIKECNLQPADLYIPVSKIMPTHCISQPAALQTGAERMDLLLPELQNQRVALVINQTSVVGEMLTPLLDTLLSSGIQVKKIFAPEHGFRGDADAGATIQHSNDLKTGIPIVSIYGKNKKPTASQLADIDIVVFDMQDVGARFYTYISTMHYVMEACAQYGKKLIICDRPNPVDYVDGPVLQLAFLSFVGMHPIPVLHGLTVGELAMMINGEKWLRSELGTTLQCQLKIIPVAGWKHGQAYLLPIKPSPNLPNDKAIQLYPSLCFFEATGMSVGRGTTFPFQVIGDPSQRYGQFSFTPQSLKGWDQSPLHQDQVCYGVDLRDSVFGGGFSLQFFLDFYNQSGLQESFFTRPQWFDLLAGSNILRKQILSGMDEDKIRANWMADLSIYRKLRKKYLLYPDYHLFSN